MSPIFRGHPCTNMPINTTLDNLQARVAAIVNQDENTSNLTSNEYSLRREYFNMAQREWSESFDWPSLYRERHSLISTSTGNTSVSLPSDFRKLAGFPKIVFDGATTQDFPEIRPQEKFQYSDTSQYVYILGDANENYTMVVRSSTLVSGASVFLPYYRSVASLVSPSNVAMCPNPDYLVQRTLAYVWEAKNDARFTLAKAESDKILRRLLEQEQTHGEGYVDQIFTAERKHFNNFRWGKSG